MDRRTFLSLVASAPIAALAPWPYFLDRPTLAMRADAFSQLAFANQHMDIIYGVGYFRRSNADGNLIIDRFHN